MRPACIVEEGPADYVVELPNLVGWLNVNDNHGGKLYHGRRRKVLAWRQAAAEAARDAKLPHLDRARIIAQVCFIDRRDRDPGNWYPTAKAAVDGLVDGGLLDDDSTRYLTGPDMRPGPVVKEHRGLLVLHVYRLPASLEVLDRIRALHSPEQVTLTGGRTVTMCSHCATGDPYCTVSQDWPCPTVALLRPAASQPEEVAP